MGLEGGKMSLVCFGEFVRGIVVSFKRGFILGGLCGISCRDISKGRDGVVKGKVRRLGISLVGVLGGEGVYGVGGGTIGSPSWLGIGVMEVGGRGYGYSQETESIFDWGFGCVSIPCLCGDGTRYCASPPN